MEHELKTVNPYFSDIVKGNKNFEVRLNDRNFKVGDYLKLMEYMPHSKKYTNSGIIKKIEYILELNKFFDVTYSTLWSKDQLEEYGIVVLGLS